MVSPVCSAIILNGTPSSSFKTKTNFCSSGNSSNALFSSSQNKERRYSVSGLSAASKKKSLQLIVSPSSASVYTSSSKSGLCFRRLSVILLRVTINNQLVNCS